MGVKKCFGVEKYFGVKKHFGVKKTLRVENMMGCMLCGLSFIFDETGPSGKTLLGCVGVGGMVGGLHGAGGRGV